MPCSVGSARPDGREGAGRATRRGSSSAARSSRRRSPVTLQWDNGQGLDLHAHDRGRRSIHVHGQRCGRQQERQARHALSLCLCRARRRSGQQALLGACTKDMSASPTARSRMRPTTISRTDKPPADIPFDGRLGRHHRQILDGGGDPAAEPAIRRLLSRQASLATRKAYQADYRLERRRHRAGRDAQHLTQRLFAGAKVVTASMRHYEDKLGVEQIRSGDRLGLVHGSSPSRSSGCSISSTDTSAISASRSCFSRSRSSCSSSRSPTRRIVR